MLQRSFTVCDVLPPIENIFGRRIHLDSFFEPWLHSAVVGHDSPKLSVVNHSTHIISTRGMDMTKLAPPKHPYSEVGVANFRPRRCPESCCRGGSDHDCPFEFFGSYDLDFWNIPRICDVATPCRSKLFASPFITLGPHSCRILIKPRQHVPAPTEIGPSAPRDRIRRLVPWPATHFSFFVS